MKCKNCGEEIYYGHYITKWLHSNTDRVNCDGGITAEPEETPAIPLKGHLTVIYDDGEETTILDVQKIEDFSMDIQHEEAVYYPYSVTTYAPSVRHISFGGKPITNKDGSCYTFITRAKED